MTSNVTMNRVFNGTRNFPLLESDCWLQRGLKFEKNEAGENFKDKNLDGRIEAQFDSMGFKVGQMLCFCFLPVHLIWEMFFS